jgi:ADP-ribose pyrophosphatase YjhB (NUDIX family)
VTALVENPYPRPGEVRIDGLRVAAAAVVLDAEGRVLLQRRSDNGHWGLPGGGVEIGEPVSATVAREVREETGYEVEPLRLVGVYSDPAILQVVRYPDGRAIQYVTVLFECRLAGGAAALSDETTAIDWRRPDDLPEPFVPSHRIRLRDALERRAEAFVR